MESLGQMKKLVGTTRKVLCMLGAFSFALSCGSCSTKNKPSESKAANFDYTLPDGSTHKLSALPAEYVILYFHNPESKYLHSRTHRTEYAGARQLFSEGFTNEKRNCIEIKNKPLRIK